MEVERDWGRGGQRGVASLRGWVCGCADAGKEDGQSKYVMHYGFF